MEDLELRNKEFEQKVKEYEAKVRTDKERIMMDKIDILQSLLEASKPDSPGAFGGEVTKYKPVLSDDNAYEIEARLMKLIAQVC